MNTTDSLVQLLNILEIIMLWTSLQITTQTAVKGVIQAYKYQSFLLALIAILSATQSIIDIVTKQGQALTSRAIIQMAVSFIATPLLPLFLGFLIEGLLARATLALPGFRVWPTRQERQVAERIWLKRESKNSPITYLVFCALVFVAFWIAFHGIPNDLGNFDDRIRVGLMISLTLHLTGLFNMIIKGDIISQVVGLLTMDHGLFLAVIKLVDIPVPATFFVISLYFYTLITLAILYLLIPQVQRLAGSINLDEISDSSELEG